MRRYEGTRTDTGPAVTVIEDDGQAHGLDPRHDLRNHSPTGFSWGYAGSGPAQLALALAADVLQDDERAQDVYQQLKFQLIGRLPDQGWVLTDREIRAAIENIEHAQARSR